MISNGFEFKDFLAVLLIYLLHEAILLEKLTGS
jgi:hypothetical protein